MRVTEAIAMEHVTLLRVFREIELGLPRVRLLAELRGIAGTLQGLLEEHGWMETDLAFVPLDHALHYRNRASVLPRD
jgi:hypothetical protein